MNKTDLIEVLSRVVSTRKEALQVIEATFGAMRQALRRGEKVVVSGFGSFHVRWRKAKVGRNPRTGETVQVPSRRTARFREAKDLWG